MSPFKFTLVQALDGFPRVSGDEPAAGTPLVGAGEFSPRERG